MIDMKPQDAINIDIVDLDRFEIHPEQNALPENGLYGYLYHPGEQHGH